MPRYCFADDNFWYIINAVMEDGGRWELSRYYKDFYDLQINLIQEFPMESGNVKGYERSLPYMPGPVTYVTDSISSGRRANLDEYVKNLLKLGPHIASGYLVRRFFAPRESDRQVEQEQQSTNPYRLSAASGHSTEHSQGAVSSQSSTANLHQRQQGHYRSPSDLGMGSNRTAPGLRQNNSFSQGGGSGAAGAAGAALKIKVWFEEDNCIVLRMPSQFSFADLYKKLRERRRLERGLEEQDDSAANSIAASSVADGESDDELLLEYRDDEDSNFYRIENDQDLQVALERCPKLTLMVSPRTKR